MENRLHTWLLSATLVLVLGAYWQIRDLRVAVRELSAYVQGLGPETPHIEVLQVSTTYMALHEGTKQPHTVTTVKNQGESDADFRARHFAAVTADQEGEWPLAGS